MTQVLVDSQRFADGDRAQSRGTIICEPYSLVIDSGAFVTPAEFIVAYPGEAVTITLDELPTGNAWKVRLEVDGLVIERLVYPTGAGPVNLADLPDLDPETLLPVPTPSPAWEAYTDGAIAIEASNRDAAIALATTGMETTTGAAAKVATETAARVAGDNTLTAALGSKADLVGGLIPASQLPSYVDDVLEFDNLAAFPAIGETSKIYVAKDTNLTYRWGGSAYGALDPSLALGETSSTGYRGDRGKVAYDYAQAHDQVDNTRDAIKPISGPQQTALDAKAARPGIAAAVPLRAYGASTLGTPGTAVSIYFNRLRRRLQSKTWFNNGVNGAFAADCCAYAYGAKALNSQGAAADEEGFTSRVGTFTPSAFTGGVILLDVLGNSSHYDGVTTSGGTTAKSRTSATNALDALIRLLRAQTITEDNNAAFTYAGTWTDALTQPSASGSRSKPSTVVGSTASFTAQNGDTLILTGYDAASSGLTGSTWSLTRDGGTAYKTGTSHNQNRIGGSGIGMNTGWGQYAVPIEGLAAGSHTFVLTHTGSAGNVLTIDCLLRESTKPPTIIVVKKNYLAAAGYAEIVALGGLTASTATDDIYNAIADTVIARFPADGSVTSWDPNAAGFNPATMIGTADGFHVHFNDLGNQFYADSLGDLINALPARDGLVRVS